MGQLPPQKLVPATLAHASDGTPYSAAYDDVYHSAQGGLAQARHVFLQGNGLPGRWQGRRIFTVLETGFGLGLNFLATWQAWRDDPQRCERLHFVSIEKHPFTNGDLNFLWGKHPEFPLVHSWPLLVPGMHRVELEGGKVVLTLYFGDIADGLPQLQLAADAIYLDGFSPAKNPAMWEPRLLRHLGRLAAPGATLATWSVLPAVLDAVRGAGFSAETGPGFGNKKKFLLGCLIRKARELKKHESRKALVIGAGVAGAAVAERLAARGWQVTVLEKHAAPAQEASGNPAGVFHPLVSPDDSLFARFSRASFLYLLHHFERIQPEWQRCGVLQRARNDKEREAQQRALATLGYPADYASYDKARDGLWFPQGGWVKPRTLVTGLLKNIEVIFSREVAVLEKENENWKAKDAQGGLIASAPVVVLANAADALRLFPQPSVRLQRVRGQLTLIPPIAGLHHVLLRGGMALPGIDGHSMIGASYDIDDPDPQLRVASHAANLERLEQVIPGAARGLDPAKLDGRVAFRAVVRDRLPLAGRLAEGLYGAFAYGSRGLLWAGLCGELIASELEGEPLPVERKLAAAVAPERFLLKEKRTRATAVRA